MKPPLCEYNCNNSKGSYNCICPIGYRLSKNGHNCRGLSLVSLKSQALRHILVKISMSVKKEFKNVQKIECASIKEDLLPVSTLHAHQLTLEQKAGNF